VEYNDELYNKIPLVFNDNVILGNYWKCKDVYEKRG